MSTRKKTSISSHLVNLEDYQKINKLNEGGFGIVYLIESKKDGQRLVAKVNRQQDGSTPTQLKFIAREIGILMRVEGPTIVRFCGFSLEDFGKNSNVTILMKYYETGSLRQLIEQEQKNASPHQYDNTAKQIILCGIAHGMMTLHSRRVLHRDLKPDNVLLDINYRPHITDFGLSKFLDPNNSKSQSMSGCGTASYMAPEVILDTHYDMKSDVYSFGILMFEVLTGEFAFSELRKKKNFNSFQITSRVVNGERPTFKGPIKPSFQNLVQRCLSQDPKERPTFEELFHKLSLSLEDDDKTIESSLKDMIFSKREAEEDDKDEFEYLLDNVDIDQLFDYVYDITNERAKNDEELRLLIDEQAECIRSLKEQHQQEIDKLKTENIKNQQEIELLKSKLNEISKQTVEQLSAGEPMLSDRIVESSTPLTPKIEIFNPLEGLTIEQIGKKIKNECLKRITIPTSVTSIGGRAFYNCSSLTQITIPSSVTSIGYSAFSDCSSLTQITIPSSVTSIGNYAFYNCSSLTQITIPSSVTSIGDWAFADNNSLTQIAIPSSVTSIGPNAFYNCSNLDSNIITQLDIRFGSRVKIESVNPLKELTISEMKEKILQEQLRQITIPSSVTSIEQDAFSECTSLTQITILPSVTTIGQGAFSGCSSLAQITIPSSVTTIGEGAFSSCSSLAQITIPSSVTTIGWGAFSGCSSLTQITIPSSVTLIEKDSFFNCTSLKQITIPSSVTSIGKDSFSGCTSLKQITIPSSVTTIGASAFFNCSSFEQIIIPSSVTSIGDNAFYRCGSLTQITIPSSVTSIGEGAFSDCSSLTQITIPSSVTSIEDWTFSGCSSLTQITIPSSVTSIGMKSFYNCSSLTQITIPSSVTSISIKAFYNCKFDSSTINQLKTRFGPSIF